MSSLAEALSGRPVSQSSSVPLQGTATKPIEVDKERDFEINIVHGRGAAGRNALMIQASREDLESPEHLELIQRILQQRRDDLAIPRTSRREINIAHAGGVAGSNATVIHFPSSYTLSNRRD